MIIMCIQAMLPKGLKRRILENFKLGYNSVKYPSNDVSYIYYDIQSVPRTYTTLQASDLIYAFFALLQKVLFFS